MPPPITYSPAFTLVPTYGCFNRCSYCNFRAEPGAPWLDLNTARQILTPLRSQGIIEILILSGEVHPHDPQRGAWIQRVYDLACLALELGFLPHTNAGVLSYAEMHYLKEVNASMGLMLETTSERLLQTVHRLAPSKVPQIRVEQLIWAGELQIPFTTGLLLGIGETPTERIQTLEAIAHVHQRYGHIQEVILQPHRRGGKQTFRERRFSESAFIDLIRTTQAILGPTVAIQVPPNLIQDLSRALQAGCTDLGGIGPVDVVNPDYDQPVISQLQGELQHLGYGLIPRLPIYPQYYPWVSSKVAPVLDRLINPNDAENPGSSASNLPLARSLAASPKLLGPE